MPGVQQPCHHAIAGSPACSSAAACPPPPGPALAPAARVLLAWKHDSFTTGGWVADQLRSWEGWLPCDEAWFGVGCTELAGVPRVTSIHFNLSTPHIPSRSRIILELSPRLAALPLTTL